MDEAAPFAEPPVTGVQPEGVVQEGVFAATMQSRNPPSPVATVGIVAPSEVALAERAHAVLPCVPSKLAEQPVVLKVQAPPVVTAAVPTLALEFVTSVRV